MKYRIEAQRDNMNCRVCGIRAIVNVDKYPLDHYCPYDSGVLRPQVVTEHYNNLTRPRWCPWKAVRGCDMGRWLKDMFELIYIAAAAPVLLLILAVCGLFKKKRRPNKGNFSCSLNSLLADSDRVIVTADDKKNLITRDCAPANSSSHIAARVGSFDVHRDGTIHARKPVGPPRDARGRFAKKYPNQVVVPTTVADKLKRDWGK